MKRGWWTLKAEYHDGTPPSDTDLEHIAKRVAEGYREGELVDAGEDDEHTD